MAKKSETRTSVEIGGRELSVSNLDKVLYPETGTTKAEIIDYYVRVAPMMLPHLRDRPVTLVRWPNGTEGHSFFEKNCPKHHPEWVDTLVVDSHSAKEGKIEYCVIDDVAGVAWAANLAALELHVPMARCDAIERPTAVVFDLDPGPPAGVLDCARIALVLRDLLGQVGLEVVVKTSGSKGLHLGVPLNPAKGKGATYEETTPFAEAVASTLAKHMPDKVTQNMRKDLRPGKIFIDWSQNSRHKTTVCAYSLRGKAAPTVSTPITWDEVQATLDADDPEILRFTATDVLERIEEIGDPFEPMVSLRQKLPSAPTG